MQRLEVSGAVRPLYGSLGVEALKTTACKMCGYFEQRPVWALTASGTKI
jgi:hypothetical protein